MPSPDPQHNEELLNRIAEGDERAFKVLFDAYRGRLLNYIFRFIKSEQVAEELVMDVFIKIWTGREFVTRIKNWDAFLFRVAHNKCIDFLRAAAGNIRLKDLLWAEIRAAASQQADAPLLSREYEAEIRAAIALLPPQRAKIYRLSREQDLTHDQIALRLNISKSTVNNHIVEASRFIRNHLAANVELAAFVLLAERL